MKATRRLLAVSLTIAAFLAAGPAPGQTHGSYGRMTIFGNMQRTKFDGGASRSFNTMTLTFTLRSPVTDASGLEYAFDVRGSAYPSAEERSTRTTIYDGWAGGRTAGGRLAFRAGQMWINDLGAVGSVGGAMAEFRARPISAGGMRFGLFAGAEPKNFDAGYVSGVRKGGGWLAYDGARNRRHVVGYVLMKDSSLTERSVITTMNFIPVGKKLFIYQTGEYDLRGPGGIGKGGLNYIFANARFTPMRSLEFMGTYHHGRSIDTRSITQDVLNGRPVDQKALDGFLFESAGGRISVEPMRNVRIYGGYARDKNNNEDKAAGRITAGLWAGNIAGSGIDLTLSDNRMKRSNRNNDAWYASIGHSFGPRVYLSADYSTSLSLIRITDSGGATIDSRPKSKRYGVNGVWNVNRTFSTIFTVEQLKETGTSDDRALLGLTYRF